VGGDAFGRGSISGSAYTITGAEELNPSQTGGRHSHCSINLDKENGKGRLKHGVIYTSEFRLPLLNQEMPAPKKVKAIKITDSNRQRQPSTANHHFTSLSW
jgi:hypothetical protein